MKRLGKWAMVLAVLCLAGLTLFGCGEEPEPEPKVEAVVDYELAELGKFTGTLTDGKPTEGRLTSGDFVYEGTFEDGFKLTGSGTISYQNGDVLYGTFVNGKLDGYGKASYMESGCVGIGYWKNGQLEGKAYFCWPQAVGIDIYFGDYVNGVRKGQGVYHFADGSYYEGEFDGWINGTGTFYWPGGNRFHGEFVGGDPKRGSTGYGVMDGTEGWIHVDEETGAWSWGTAPEEE